MADKINKYSNDKKMLSKSMITNNFKKEYPMFKDIPLKEIKEEFDNQNGEYVLVGSPYDKMKRKHVKYINKDLFANRLFREYFRISKRR